jgi:hypothetical protein
MCRVSPEMLVPLAMVISEANLYCCVIVGIRTIAKALIGDLIPDDLIAGNVVLGSGDSGHDNRIS